MNSAFIDNLRHNKKRAIALAVLALLVGFYIAQKLKTPATNADWQIPLSRLSTAEFNGDLVTVKNVRNFRYNGSENDQDLTVQYYDHSYDLNKIKKVWYVTAPFNGFKIAAHTFLSFEFENNDFLSISIEARKTKGQVYSIVKGLFHTYPLMYIATDERDAIFVRANIRKDDVYVYPVKLSSPEKGRLLLVDMLETMNDLEKHPTWYNTLTRNCTSSIADHVKKISPERLPLVIWQGFVSGYADKLAIEQGLIDTDLSLEQAREKYYISEKSRKIDAVENYSQLIREFDVK